MYVLKYFFSMNLDYIANMKERRQILLGTLLGKSFIVRLKGRNCFLTAPESLDLNWLNYKANIIDSEKNVFIKDGKRFLWRSRCGIFWNDVYKEFYKNNKKNIEMRILDELRDIGLCAWFLDKGKFKRGKLWLGTTVFGKKGNEVIARYFNEVGMPCKMQPDRNTAKIVFSKYGTKVFIDTIIGACPKFMYYRIDP